MDLTPGDGELAMFAYRNNIPYTGLCLTDVHCEKLEARLFQKICSAMLDEGDKLFEPRLRGSRQKTQGEDGNNGGVSKMPDDAKTKARKKSEDPHGAELDAKRKATTGGAEQGWEEAEARGGQEERCRPGWFGRHSTGGVTSL